VSAKPQARHNVDPENLHPTGCVVNARSAVSRATTILAPPLRAAYHIPV